MRHVRTAAVATLAVVVSCLACSPGAGGSGRPATGPAAEEPSGPAPPPSPLRRDAAPSPVPEADAASAADARAIAADSAASSEAAAAVDRAAGPPADASTAPRDLGPLPDGLPVSGWMQCGPGKPQITSAGTLVPLKPRPDVSLLVGAGPGGKDPLPGDLDNLRYYDRVLRPDEILAHAQKRYQPCTAAAGCVAELKLDGQQGGAFPDTGPNALAAKVVGVVASVDGVEGQSARFDGKGWLEIPHHKALEFTRTFSFEAWVRWPGACPTTAEFAVGKCQFMRIFDKSNDLRLDMHAGGHRFDLSSWVFHGVGYPPRNGWHHLAITHDDRVGVLFYKNGQLARACTIP